jgi:hypothetical protein
VFVDTQQWKSNLQDTGDTISKFLQSLDCELVSDTSPSRCSSWDITEENVSMLLSARTRNCTAALDRMQTSNAPSVSAARADQQISKGTADNSTHKLLPLSYLRISSMHMSLHIAVSWFQ